MNFRLKFLILAAAAMLSSAPAMAGGLDRIREAGVIRLGVREASRPFSFVNEKKEAAGYTVELCVAIANAVRSELKLDKLGVEFVTTMVDDRVDMLKSGKIDLECGTTTHTLARQAEVDFTSSIFVGTSSVLVKKAANIKKAEDLAGKKIGVIPGTTTEAALKRIMPSLSPAPTLVTMKDHDEGVAAIDAGKVDAYASDQVILIGQGYKAKDPKALEVPDISLSYEPYGIMLRQGDDDLRLVADRELARLYRSGEVMKIYDHWLRPLIGEPIPILKSMYVLYALPE